MSLLDRPRLAPVRRLRKAIAHELDHRWAPSHIDDYLDGELSPEQRRRLEHHVDECPECSRVLRGLRTVLSGLTTMRDRRPAAEVNAGVIERLRAEASGEERQR